MSHYRAQFQKGHGERQFRERYGSEVTGGGPEPVQFAAFTWVNITFGNIKNGIMLSGASTCRVTWRNSIAASTDAPASRR